MNGNDLLEAMGFVDEKYIQEAAAPVKKKIHWVRYSALAACLCLVLGGWYLYDNLTAVHTPAVMTAQSVQAEDSLGAARNSLELQDKSADTAPVQLKIKVLSLSENKLTALVMLGTDAYPEGTEIQVLLPEEAAEPRADEELILTFLPEETVDGCITAQTLLPIEP